MISPVSNSSVHRGFEGGARRQMPAPSSESRAAALETKKLSAQRQAAVDSLPRTPGNDRQAALALIVRLLGQTPEVNVTGGALDVRV